MQRQRDPLKESMLVPRGRKEFVINSTFRAITGFELRTRPVTSLPLVAGFMSDFQSLLVEGDSALRSPSAERLLAGLFNTLVIVILNLEKIVRSFCSTSIQP